MSALRKPMASALEGFNVATLSRYVVLTACLLGFSFSAVLAQNAVDGEGLTGLSLLEHTVFAQTFETQDFEQRISRLEQTVFGEAQTGDVNARQDRLTQLILSVQPVKTPAPKQALEQAAATVKNPDATEYPVVVALERKIIGRDFVHSPLNLRLNRLEQSVFGHTFETKALSDRVDQLIAKYPEVQQSLTQTEETTTNSVLSNLPQTSSQFVGKSDTYTKLAVLERNFYGETYDEELITERLDRLEKKAFGYSLSGQSVNTRLGRLVDGYASGYNQTPRYPARYAGTQTMRPAYTETETIQSSTAPGAQQKQNIAVGTSAISNNTYKYSPEIVEMLPPDLKRQYYQQHGYPSHPSPSASGSTVLQNSSTVILPNGSSTQTNYSTAGGTVSRSTQYSGFQTYSDPTGMNQPSSLKYQNYYVNPNGQGYTQSKTEVYTAPGSTLTVTKQKYIPSQMPGYTGHPSVLQHLNQLEANVYARDYSADTVPRRLTRLEQALTGRAYPDFTEAERLNNLLKVYQYQSLARYLGQPLPAGQNSGGGVKLKIPLN